LKVVAGKGEAGCGFVHLEMRGGLGEG